MRELDPVFGAGLRKAYEAGASTPELAARHDVTYRQMRQWLIEVGTTMRQGSARRPPPTSRVADAMAAAYRAGWTIQDIAAETGETHDRVRRSLHRSGVEMRPGGPRQPCPATSP